MPEIDDVDPCATCGGSVIASHGPYANDAGERICAICDVKRDPELFAIMAGALARIKAHREAS